MSQQRARRIAREHLLRSNIPHGKICIIKELTEPPPVHCGPGQPRLSTGRWGVFFAPKYSSSGFIIIEVDAIAGSVESVSTNIPPFPSLGPEKKRYYYRYI